MKNDLKAIIALATTYMMGNFLLLLSRGIYWDDWYYWLPIIQHKDYELLWQLASQSKLYTAFSLFYFLSLTSDPIFTFKLLSLLSWLATGLLIYGILRKKFSLAVNRAFFLAASVILIPLFLVKTEMSILQYSVNNFLFFLAAFTYFTAEKSVSKFIKYSGYLLSGILFFTSFLTNSLLIFYLGFLGVLLIFYRRENKERPFLSFLYDFGKRYFFFLILPLIFGLLKITIGQPTGSYEGYNQFSFPASINDIWFWLAYGFFWPLIAPLTILHRKIFAGLFLIILAITYLVTKKTFSSPETEKDNPKYYLIAGMALFILGAIPYILVGKPPHIYGTGFSMRNALLLPLGSSLIILGVILAIVKEKWQSLVQVIILSLFSVFTIYNYFGQDMDWYKQLAVIESLKTAEDAKIISASALIFSDKAGLNWQNRSVHGEEYAGYVQAAFPKNNMKWAVAEGRDPEEEFKGFKEYQPNVFPPDFNPGKKIVKVSVVSEAKHEIFTVKRWLKLKQLEIFSDEQSFLQELKKEVPIKVIIQNN